MSKPAGTDTENRQRVFDLLKQRRSVTSNDLPWLTQQASLACLNLMVKRGLIYRSKTGVRTVRFFLTCMEAEAHSRKNMPQPKAKGSSDSISKFKAQPAITPKHVVIQRQPTQKPRFYVDPSFKGPFQLAGIGRDVETGRGW